MTKRTATIVMALLGTAMMLVIVGVVVIAWVFVSAFQRDSATETVAGQTFDEVRQHFSGVAAVIRLEDGTPVVTRQPPASAAGTPLTTLHIMAWEQGDGKLTRATVPFWLLRLKHGPLELSSESTGGITIRRPLIVTVADIERYGPSLLLDEQHGSERVLIWTE